jgi:hypothetical protein
MIMLPIPEALVTLMMAVLGELEDYGYMVAV